MIGKRKPLIAAVSIILAFGIWFFNRANDEVPDGGPCSYQVTQFPAIILSVDSLADSQFDLSALVSRDGATDTLYFSQENNQYLDIKQINTLGVGDTIYYEHHQITSGACNPDVFMFSLEKR